MHTARQFSIAVVVVGLMVAACAPPSQHDPIRYGRLRVALAADVAQSPTRMAWAREVAAAMEAMGPTIEVHAGPPAPGDVVVETAPVELSRWLDVSTPRRVALRADVLADADRFRAALAHGLGHALGAGHVCVDAATEARDCAQQNPAAEGSVMRPSPQWDDDPRAQGASANRAPALVWHPTDADLRAMPAR